MAAIRKYNHRFVFDCSLTPNKTGKRSGSITPITTGPISKNRIRQPETVSSSVPIAVPITASSSISDLPETLPTDTLLPTPDDSSVQKHSYYALLVLADNISCYANKHALMYAVIDETKEEKGGRTRNKSKDTKDTKDTEKSNPPSIKGYYIFDNLTKLWSFEKTCSRVVNEICNHFYSDFLKESQAFQKTHSAVIDHCASLQKRKHIETYLKINTVSASKFDGNGGACAQLLPVNINGRPFIFDLKRGKQLPRTEKHYFTIATEMRVHEEFDEKSVRAMLEISNWEQDLAEEEEEEDDGYELIKHDADDRNNHDDHNIDVNDDTTIESQHAALDTINLFNIDKFTSVLETLEAQERDTEEDDDEGRVNKSVLQKYAESVCFSGNHYLNMLKSLLIPQGRIIILENYNMASSHLQWFFHIFEGFVNTDSKAKVNPATRLHVFTAENFTEKLYQKYNGNVTVPSATVPTTVTVPSTGTGTEGTTETSIPAPAPSSSSTNQCNFLILCDEEAINSRLRLSGNTAILDMVTTISLIKGRAAVPVEQNKISRSIIDDIFLAPLLPLSKKPASILKSTKKTKLYFGNERNFFVTKCDVTAAALLKWRKFEKSYFSKPCVGLNHTGDVLMVKLYQEYVKHMIESGSGSNSSGLAQPQPITMEKFVLECSSCFGLKEAANGTVVVGVRMKLGG